MHETAKAVHPPACCKYDIYKGIIIIIFTVFVNLLVVIHIEKHRKQLGCKKVFIAWWELMEHIMQSCNLYF